MVRLPTNLIAGQAGHVAHSNQAYELLNQIQDPTYGSRVINVLDPPSYVSSVKAVGDSVADDNVALQNIFDWLQEESHPANHIVFFPFFNASGNSARYLTSKPLRVWSNTRIKGPATIKAHPTFDWVNHPYWQHPQYKPVGNPQPGDIGLMELWNAGTARGGTSRLFVDDITLNCDDQPGSLGLFSKCQQPGYFLKLRIDKASVGWQLWGQQVDSFMTVIVDCPIGLYLGPDLGGLGTFGAAGTSAKFMAFYSFNVEAYTDAAVVMNCDGPNWFYSCHFERGIPGDTDTHVIEALSGQWSLRNGWATHGGDPSHIFVIGDQVPIPGPINTAYSIEDFRLGGTNVNGQLMIDDKVRGIQRPVSLQRYIDHFRTNFQGDTQYDYDASIEYVGDEGGFVRIGGLKGGSSAPAGHSGAQFSVKPNTGQDEPTMRSYDQTGVLRSGFGQRGDIFLGSYTTAARPLITGLPGAVGIEGVTEIFDTTLNKPIWLRGGVWRDATGTTV